MKAPRPIHLRRIFLCAGVGIAATLVACIGNYIESIHFYSASVPGKEVIDFGRVPSEVMVTGWNLEPGRGGSKPSSGIPDFLNYYGHPAAEGFDKYELEYMQDDPEFKFRKTIQRARNIEARGNLRQALAVYGEVAQSLRVQSFINDREEILATGVTLRSKGMSAYLKHRYQLEFGGETMQIRALQALKSLSVDRRLKPHLDYTLASKLDRNQRKTRAEAFLAVAKKYPRSQRVEPSMVMASRSYLETVEGNGPEEADWKVGIKLLDRVVERDPNTRFIGGYYGWHGADELRRGNTNKAIYFYLKQSKLKSPRESWKGHEALADIALKAGRPAEAAVHWLKQRQMPVEPHFKYVASQRLRNSFGEFTAKDALVIQDRIKKDAHLLSSYLDFRVDDTPLPPEQEKALLKYATTSIRRTGSRDAGLYSRLAQLQYNAGMYREAIQSAQRVRRGRSEAHIRLRYVQASSLARLGKNSEAIAVYESIYKQTAHPFLRHATGENLALLHERHGDPRRSFMIYRDLGYTGDLGYIVDCVMTPSQIKSVIPRIESRADRHIFTYALAMRYFRGGDYQRAAQTLRTLPKSARMHGGLTRSEYKEVVEGLYFDRAPKTGDILDDVVAMSRLRAKADHGATRESRAQALYSLAQYVQKRRTLLFYSHGLWKGGRASLYGIYWNLDINKGRDNELVIKRNVEHECDGQAMLFCDELIRKYPKSKLVPKALYTAAVSANKLGSLNGFWQERSTPYYAKATKYLKRLFIEHPKDPLAQNAEKYAEVFGEQMKPDYSSQANSSTRSSSSSTPSATR